jgi:hypothetical protein
MPNLNFKIEVLSAQASYLNEYLITRLISSDIDDITSHAQPVLPLLLSLT